jgi:CubicO group peptidase (beta-lactamase class C family)
MTDNTSTIQTIVNSNCGALLKQLQTDHPNEGVGISVALYYPRNPDVPNFFSYGSAGPGINITPKTVYGIGSVTKVFTSALAAYLSVREMIGELDKTLAGTYLSNVGCNPSGVSGDYWKKLTFAQLATQTSGMPDEAPGLHSDQLFTDQPPSCHLIGWWNDDQESFLSNLGYWIYSSAGFVTLGFAVAAAGNKGGLTGGYTEMLKNVITGPIDMPNTFAADDVAPGAVLAQGYDRLKPVPITDASDLKSSAQDMLAWLGAVYQAMQLQACGATLSPLQQALADTTNTWIANPLRPDKKPTGFAMGLAWQIPTFGTAQVLIKNGATSKGGCSCWVGLTRYASNVPPVGVALMTNQIGVDPDPCAQSIIKQIMDLGQL